MREITFRGKKIDNGKWVEGDLATNKDLAFISNFNNGVYRDMCKVDESSVGQYIGVKDVDGEKIFEGDIIEYRECGYNSVNGYVIFKDCEFYVKSISDSKEDYRLHGLDDSTEIKVVGNIYDNKELLK